MKRTNVLQFQPRSALPTIDLNERLVRYPEATWIFQQGGKLLVVERGLAPQMHDRVITQGSEGNFVVSSYANGQVWGTVRFEITSLCEVTL